MLVCFHEGLDVIWQGQIRFGTLLAIVDHASGEALHRGSREYISMKWRKLTGKELEKF